MRIDFNASFRHINQIIASPVKYQAEINGRASLRPELSSESSFQGQLTKVSGENICQSLPNVILESTGNQANKAEGFLSSLPPELKLPELELLAQGPTEVDASVSKPSILAARRLSPEATVDIADVKDIKSKIVATGREYGIDPALSLAVAKAESSYNQLAVSNDGHESKGIFQLLDGTGQGTLSRINLTEGYEPFDHEQNTLLGTAHLRYLHDLFAAETELNSGAVTKAVENSAALEKFAVAAYNAGEGRVASAQQRAAKAGKDPSDFEQVRDYLPESTVEYVQRVLSYRSQIASDFEA